MSAVVSSVMQVEYWATVALHEEEAVPKQPAAGGAPASVVRHELSDIVQNAVKSALVGELLDAEAVSACHLQEIAGVMDFAK